MLTKATYIAQRTAAIAALDIEIARLTEFADRAGDDVALAYFEAIDALQSQRDTAVARLRELRTVNEKIWRHDPATRGLELAWNGVRRTILGVLAVRNINCSVK